MAKSRLHLLLIYGCYCQIWMDGWMDGWKDGWMDGQDGWLDGWMAE